VSGAVNVRIVTFFGFIFDVSGIDGDTTGFFFRGLVDGVICLVLGQTLQAQIFGDRGSQGSFAMVDVADRADIYMGLVSLKMLFAI
jgi:hypothetical protein